MRTPRLFTAIKFALVVLFSPIAADVSDFGTAVGQSQRTVAYSNGHDDVDKLEAHFAVSKDGQKVPSGMKWQCVEYARRWLIENRNITFPSVHYAFQIWDFKHAEEIDTHKQLPWQRHKNRESTTAPQVGDLLIYGLDFAHTGHVAVVVGVDANSVTVAEQNYLNRTWENPQYARRLLLDQDDAGRYRVFDDSLIGWMSLKQ